MQEMSLRLTMQVIFFFSTFQWQRPQRAVGPFLQISPSAGSGQRHPHEPALLCTSWNDPQFGIVDRFKAGIWVTLTHYSRGGGCRYSGGWKFYLSTTNWYYDSIQANFGAYSVTTTALELRQLLEAGWDSQLRASRWQKQSKGGRGNVIADDQRNHQCDTGEPDPITQKRRKAAFTAMAIVGTGITPQYVELLFRHFSWWVHGNDDGDFAMREWLIQNPGGPKMRLWGIFRQDHDGPLPKNRYNELFAIFEWY